jgi:hypothetical protein
MPILEINLDLSVTIQPFAPSSVGSAPNKDKDKYHVDYIKDPTPWSIEAEALLLHTCRTLLKTLIQ